MPNHCENDLYIIGPWYGFEDADKAREQADIQAVLEFIGMMRPEPTFDFNTLIPYAEPWAAMDKDSHEMFSPCHAIKDPVKRAAALEGARAAYAAKWHTDKDGYNSGGYKWCCDNWDTKWNAYDVVRRDYDGDTIVTFQTAWSPPLKVIAALAAKFPHMTFRLEYFERGMEFCGGVTWRAESETDEDEPRFFEWKAKYHGSRGS